MVTSTILPRPVTRGTVARQSTRARPKRESPPDSGGAWWLPRYTKCPGRSLGLLSGLLLQRLDRARIGQSRGVAQILVALCDGPEDTAHDLAAPRLREGVGEDQVVRAGDGAYCLPDVVAQLPLELIAALSIAFEGHVGEDGLA